MQKWVFFSYSMTNSETISLDNRGCTLEYYVEWYIEWWYNMPIPIVRETKQNKLHLYHFLNIYL